MGIGISGLEGLQATLASDYAIAQVHNTTLKCIQSHCFSFDISSNCFLSMEHGITGD